MEVHIIKDSLVSAPRVGLWRAFVNRKFVLWIRRTVITLGQP